MINYSVRAKDAPSMQHFGTRIPLLKDENQHGDDVMMWDRQGGGRVPKYPRVNYGVSRTLGYKKRYSPTMYCVRCRYGCHYVL